MSHNPLPRSPSSPRPASSSSSEWSTDLVGTSARSSPTPPSPMAGASSLTPQPSSPSIGKPAPTRSTFCDSNFEFTWPPVTVKTDNAMVDAGLGSKSPNIAVQAPLDWNEKYNPNKHRVTLLSEDGKAFSVESEALGDRSAVFHDMLAVGKVGNQDASTAKAIDIPAAADVLELFLDLLPFPAELTAFKLTSDVRQTHCLIKLAARFEADDIDSYAYERLVRLNQWSVLKYADETNNIELARGAVKRLPFNYNKHYEDGKEVEKDFDMWREIASLKPSWQFGLLRCLLPSVTAEYTGNGFHVERSVLRVADLAKAAESFKPEAGSE